MKMLRRHWVLIVSNIVFLSAGYVISSVRNQDEIGERAISNFMDGLAALSYLEKQDVSGARQMLRITIDNNLLAMYRYGTPAFDKSTASRPNSKDTLLAQYDSIRKKYPPIDYSDGGATNQDVDRILNSARVSLEKKASGR